MHIDEKQTLTSRYTHQYAHSFGRCALLLEILLFGKMKQLLMVVVFLITHQEDHWKLNTLCAQHNKKNGSIRYLNNRSCHLNSSVIEYLLQ